jgi:predicted nucleic acid-binding protein
MAPTLYLLDTNAVSDLMILHPVVRPRARQQRRQGATLGLCHPVYYEILRGLYWRQATAKLAAFNQHILPLLTWVNIIDHDWEQAARFWSDTRSKGRQLGDPDLLLAALAYPTDGIVVSSDTDFDALPITREDWRVSASQ